MGSRGPKAKPQPNNCPKCDRIIIPLNTYGRYNHKHGICEACRSKMARNLKLMLAESCYDKD